MSQSACDAPKVQHSHRPSCSSSSSRTVASIDFDTDSDSGECDLLEDLSLEDRDASDHELKTSPVITRAAYRVAGSHHAFPQRGLLGSIITIEDKSDMEDCLPKDRRLYVNTNAPFSAIICGVQGSGKSHTVSVLVENMLISNYPPIGKIDKVLSGLVLHFGEGCQPSETAWIGVANSKSIRAPHVHVYVSRSSMNTMKAAYAKLGPHITVEPLLFSESELDAQAFLSMMAIGSSESAPLYMQTVLSILRDLGENYSYQAFKMRLEEQRFLPNQLAGLKQRMKLLESFLDKRPAKQRRLLPPRFVAGQLTIVDLSDPFIDSASACSFFEIIVRLFIRAKVDTGKFLVVDEAHKYLSSDGGSSGLTESLSSLIRQQRHEGMRVIISTQEPNVVPPVLIDLCGICILHRFSSPSWLEFISKHVSADMASTEAFEKVVRLQTGQAIVLAPTGLAMLQTSKDSKERRLEQLGRSYMLVKTRKRVTKDGGASILVHS